MVDRVITGHHHIAFPYSETLQLSYCKYFHSSSPALNETRVAVYIISIQPKLWSFPVYYYFIIIVGDFSGSMSWFLFWTHSIVHSFALEIPPHLLLLRGAFLLWFVWPLFQHRPRPGNLFYFHVDRVVDPPPLAGTTVNSILRYNINYNIFLLLLSTNCESKSQHTLRSHSTHHFGHRVGSWPTILQFDRNDRVNLQQSTSMNVLLLGTPFLITDSENYYTESEHGKR